MSRGGTEWIVGNREVTPGCGINIVRIRLGHESLDVTLAHLKGKDTEPEETHEQINSSRLALEASSWSSQTHGGHRRKGDLRLAKGEPYAVGAGTALEEES